MTDSPILVQLPLFPEMSLSLGMPGKQPDLHTLFQHRECLPAFITDCAPAMRILDLLGPLHWDDFPERNLQRNWSQSTIPYTAFIAAELVKLNEGQSSFGRLHRHLLEHPAFISLLGFPLVPAPNSALGFNTLARGLEESLTDYVLPDRKTCFHRQTILKSVISQRLITLSSRELTGS